MMTFRYHIVSLVSLFLALAVGVALGGGPLQGKGDNTLVAQVKSERQARSDLRAQVADLRSGGTFTDQFATTAAPGLIGDRLRGHVVDLVVLPTARPADVTGLKTLVGVAGATVGGTVRVGKQLVDVSNKQLVDELGNQLEGRASGVSIAPDATPYERIGALIARAIGTDTRGGDRVDPTATSVLAGLSTTNLMSADGRLDRRGDLVLFVTGDGEGSSSAQQGASSIVTTLVHTVDGDTGGVVLAGTTASARGRGQVKAVRDDVSTAKVVSTVDALGSTVGRVVTVMALAGQAAGQAGQYGVVDPADGAMPGGRAASD